MERAALVSKSRASPTWQIQPWFDMDIIVINRTVMS
jgi:hypothetical protein